MVDVVVGGQSFGVVSVADYHAFRHADGQTSVEGRVGFRQRHSPLAQRIHVLPLREVVGGNHPPEQLELIIPAIE